jgi:hypothetical protein
VSKPVPVTSEASKPVHDSAQPTAKKKVAEWFYHDADGKPVLRVTRFAYEDGTKDYAQHAMLDGKWVTPTQAKNAGRFVNVPYDLHLWHDAVQLPIFITEGEKCADAIKKLGLYASTNAGGSQKWTDDLAPYFQGRNVIIMPDADEAGAKWCEAVKTSLAPVAATLHVAVIGTHREDKALNDVADWLEQSGVTSVDGFLPHVKSIWQEVPKTAAGLTAEKFKLVPFKDLKLNLDSEWLVTNLMPRNGVGLIFGASQTYKSFIAVDLLVAIAAGKTEWGGHNIKSHGAVVYVCAEGGGGIIKRIMGARIANHVEDGADIPFYLIDARPRLGVEQGDQADLMAAIKAQVPEGTPIAMVVVDTLSQSLGGGEENGMGMVTFLGTMLEISKRFDCVACAVHHIGKGDDKRARGHSTVEGNPDFRWLIERQDNRKTRIFIDKMKDGETEVGFDVTLEVLELGINSDGLPVTTLIVKDIESANPSATASKTIKLSPSEKSFMAYYLRVLNDNPDAKEYVKPYHDRPATEGVPDEAIREVWMKEQAGNAADEKEKKNAQRYYYNARKALINKDVIRLANHGNQTFICKISETR